MSEALLAVPVLLGGLVYLYASARVMSLAYFQAKRAYHRELMNLMGEGPNEKSRK